MGKGWTVKLAQLAASVSGRLQGAGICIPETKSFGEGLVRGRFGQTIVEVQWPSIATHEGEKVPHQGLVILLLLLCHVANRSSSIRLTKRL